jgi:pseudoazurin
MEIEMRIGFLVVGAAMAAALASPAAAKDVQVKMLNKGAAGMMVFEPSLVKIAPGDTVTFVAVDKGHNAESIVGMLPPGAVAFKGRMSQNLQVKFAKPGVYGFKCMPHYGMGMAGAVIVGNPGSNLGAAKAVSHPGKAKMVFAGILK